MSWKELIILFRSKARTGEIVCSTLLDLITAEEVSDVFHQCINSYSCGDHWSARVNSSMLLKCLCFKYRTALLPLLTSNTDGRLMALSDFCLDDLISDEKRCLYSGKSAFLDESSGSKLYKKSWLRKQRDELRRRLGIEVSSSDASTAAVYYEIVDVMIDEGDLAASSLLLPSDPASSNPEEDDELTSESWLTRVLRYLIVGLLDSQWEVRQGSCMALAGILEGLFPDNSPVTLSAALLEEIVCCSLYLLTLDRFIDLSDSSAACSPVKEMAGQLLAVAVGCLETQNGHAEYFTQALHIVVSMCESQGHWSTTAGGFIALKGLVPLVLERYEEMVPRIITLVTSVFSRDVLIDEVVVAASEVFIALQGSIHNRLKSRATNEIQGSTAILSGLEGLCVAVSAAGQKLTEFHTCYPQLFRLLSAVMTLVQDISLLSNKSDVVVASKAIEVVSGLLKTQQDLLLHMVLFSRETKLSVLSSIETSLSSLHAMLVANVDQNSQILLFSRVLPLLGTLLVMVLAESSSAVGELSLMTSTAETTESSAGAAAVESSKDSDSCELMKLIAGGFVSVVQLLQGDAGNSCVCLLLQAVLCIKIDALDLPTATTDATSSTDANDADLAAGLGELEEGGRRCSKRRKVVEAREVYRLSELAEEPVLLFSSSEVTEMETAPAHMYQAIELCLSQISASESSERLMTSLTAVYCALHRCKRRQAQFQDLIHSEKLKSSSLWSVSDNSTRRDVAMFIAALIPSNFVSSENEVAVIVRQITSLCDTLIKNSNAATKASGSRKLKFSIVPDTAGPAVPTSTTQTSTQSKSEDQSTGVAELEGLWLSLLMMRKTDVTSDVVAGLQQSLQAVIAVVSLPIKRKMRFWIKWLLAISSARALLDLVEVTCGAVGGADVISDYQTLLADQASQLMIQDDQVNQSECSKLLAALRYHQLYELVCIKLHQILQEQFFESNGPVFSYFHSEDGHSLRESDFIHLMHVLVVYLRPQDIQSLKAFNFSKFLSSVLHSGSVIASLVRVITALIKLEAPSADYLQLCLDLIQVSLFPSSTASLTTETTLQTVSQFFHSLTESLLDEWLLPLYEQWFNVALHGLGSYSVSVRRGCTAVMRMLVPLAPLAKELHSRDGSSRKQSHVGSGTVMYHLFSGGDSSDASEVDAAIALELTRITNLTIESKTHTWPAHQQHQGLIRTTVRPYQWEGVMWLSKLRRCGMGGILADEMGLGKSLEALLAVAVLQLEKRITDKECHSNPCQPSLIVCPASLLLHWKQEMLKFFPSDFLSPCIYSSSKDSVQSLVASPTLGDAAVVVIVSYDTLRINVTEFQSLVWEYLILDEAHLIRNAASATAQSLFSLRSRHRMCLTGTPVQNQVEELWSLMHFLIPDYLGDFKTFRSQWVRPIMKALGDRDALRQQEQQLYKNGASDCDDSKKGKERLTKARDKFHQSVEISAEGMLLLRKLHKQVLPFVLRRTKAAVAGELPAKTIVDVMCPLSEAQRHLYATFQQGLRMCDDQLEQELRDLKDNQYIGVKTDSDVVKKAEQSVSSNSKSGVVLQLDACGFEEEDAEQAEMLAAMTNGNRGGTSTAARAGGGSLHPFQALTYLKLVSVHPSLVVASSHQKYRDRLLSSLTHSGKMLQLTRLLLDCGVMRRSEFIGNSEFKKLEDLLQASEGVNESQLGGSTAVKQESDSDSCISGSDDEEEEEAEECKKSNGKRSGAVKKARKKLTDSNGVASDGAAPSRQEEEDPSQSVQPHRCLIFAQHKTTLDLIESLVLKQHYPSVEYDRLDGDVNPSKRAAIAQEFNAQQCGVCGYGFEGGVMSALPKAVQRELAQQRQKTGQPTSTRDIRLLLLTTGSCGLGLNLTAADTVIFVEHDWNPFVDLQAMDRVHRIGQTKPVTVFRLLAESTIEARIVVLQSRKMLVTGEIINEENSETGGSGREFGETLWGSIAMASSAAAGAGASVQTTEDWLQEESLDVDRFLKTVGQG